MDKTSLFGSSELFLKLQTVEIPESYQQLPWRWKFDSTIALFYPDFGEFLFLLGEERCGNDSLEGSRLVEGLASTQSAPNPAVGQALYQLKLHV